MTQLPLEDDLEGLFGEFEGIQELVDWDEFSEHMQDYDTAALFEKTKDEVVPVEGDTKRSRPDTKKQCKLWCMTYNHKTYTEDELYTSVRTLLKNLIEDNTIDWAVGALEYAPSTHKPHIQAACHFTTKKRLSEAMKKLGDKNAALLPHIEQCLGDAKSNRIYCLKLDKTTPNKDWFEFGDLQLDGPQKVKFEWQCNLMLARGGEIEACEERLQICHLHNLRSLAFAGNAKVL